MKLILALVALALLQGCAAIDSQRYLHALKTDPDCTYQGKPAEYSTPPKCGPKSYGRGHHISIVKTGPYSYAVGK
jgi:hypothetical protein